MDYPEIYDRKHYEYGTWRDMRDVEFPQAPRPWIDYIVGGACLAAVMVALVFI
jgi:hypothetical protein